MPIPKVPTLNQSCKLKRNRKVIEQEILDLSKRDGVDAAEVIEWNKMLLRNMWEERGYGDMVRVWYIS